MQENPYQRYRKVQVETASPAGLVVMLYDGALRFINQARSALLQKDYELSNTSFQRALAIINELNSSLNMSAGELSDNLRQLYLFIGKTLLQANIKKDDKDLDGIVKILMSLRDAWVEVERSERTKAVSVG